MSTHSRSQAEGQDRKAEVQAALQLDSEPTDEFMALLAELGDGDVATGPSVHASTRSYTPGEIEEVVINGTTGELLARARGSRTLASVGEEAGVTRARIQQLERSANIEIATFVRVAGACGYQVSLSLRPVREGLPQLSAVLGATAKP